MHRLLFFTIKRRSFLDLKHIRYDSLSKYIHIQFLTEKAKWRRYRRNLISLARDLRRKVNRIIEDSFENSSAWLIIFDF